MIEGACLLAFLCTHARSLSLLFLGLGLFNIAKMAKLKVRWKAAPISQGPIQGEELLAGGESRGKGRIASSLGFLVALPQRASPKNGS